MGHMTITTPLLVVIFYLFGKIWYSLPVYQIWQLYLKPFLRYGWGVQNLKWVTWRSHAPFMDGLLSISWD